ncbi:hypothetical protein QL285_029153 [Trifolium repens]|nr:hypothetical protein QL285_029153 [Trifolium repens]
METKYHSLMQVVRGNNTEGMRDACLVWRLAEYEIGAKTRSLENANKRVRIDEEHMDINQGRFGWRKQGFCFQPQNLP